MRLAKLKMGLDIFVSLVVLTVTGLWAIIYVSFGFYIPLKWRTWRAASKFKKRLIKKGMPKDAANQLTDSQFSDINIISLMKWGRALAGERKRKHGRKTESHDEAP
ncbi:MAG: hypothetical protein NWF14_02385 [Candidatus Bathyarchaeota archaeon]|nr:hypothetical protein [Candidatus Bathyarchaeota archaeon]